MVSQALVEQLEDLQDFLPAVRLWTVSLSRLCVQSVTKMTFIIGRSLYLLFQVPDEVTEHILKLNGTQLSDPRL